MDRRVRSVITCRPRSHALGADDFRAFLFPPPDAGQRAGRHGALPLHVARTRRSLRRHEGGPLQWNPRRGRSPDWRLKTHFAGQRLRANGPATGGRLSRRRDRSGNVWEKFIRGRAGTLQSAYDRRLVRRAFYYSACPDVARVVFIATPHRGGRLAGGLLGNVGRLLLHMPSPVQQRLRNILASNRTALTIKNHLRPGSSLDSLTPRSPVIAAINDLVMRPGVRLHSIVGDRGRGGPPEQSSDGVVPYESSHLPQAESERVVPAGHTGTLKRPETSAELIRILR
jgi:hypothetical protein